MSIFFKHILRWLCLAALCFSGAAWAEERTLTVAAAANMRYAFDELAAEFGRESGIKVNGVFAASGKIVAQVEGGAPFDVFLSADVESPNILQQHGFAKDEPRVYAYGLLVMWTTKDFDLNRGLTLLADASVQKVAIPNPKLAPYGRAAVSVLMGAGLYTSVEPKFVYGESIAQAAQFVESGAADVGFNAKAIVLAPELAAKGHWVELPQNSYPALAQAAVVLKHGAETQPEAARKFMEFLFSARARAILGKYGYRLP